MNDQSTLEGTSLQTHLASLKPGLDVLGLPACVIDGQMCYQYANAAYAQMSGRSSPEFMGRSVQELFPQPVADGRRSALIRALQGEVVIFNRQTLVGPSAGTWVRAHYFPLHVGGEVAAALVVLVDVQKLKDTEAELANQRRQLQLVVDNIGVPMSYIDREWRFRFANQPGADWMIPDTVNAIGKHVEEMLGAEAMAVIRPEIEAAFRGDKRSYERLARMQDGAQRWVRVHLVPDKAEDGSVRGVYSLMIDVDRDHKLRDALERQEAQLRHFAENIPGPIAVVDGDYRYVYVNQHFERLYGVKREELRGQRVPDVIGPERTAEYFEPHIEQLKRGEVCTYERLIEPPEGEARWYLVRLVPIMDDGRFNGYYVVGSDVHDIKLAQERLAAQEAQLRLYTDNIPDAVAYLNRERQILFANRHFAAQRGAVPGDVVGKTTSEFLGPELASWIAERTQRVFDHGETVTYERVAQLPGGTRHLHVKAVPDRDEAGTARGMYVVAHDITEVKEAEALIAAREQDLRFFAENIPEAIVYVDLARGCTFVNNVFLATRGFTREFALGKFPPDVYPAEVMATLQPHIERALEGEETAYERQLPVGPNAGRWIRVRISPRRGDDGKVVGYYVVSTDIDAIKRAQAEVEDKERQLRQVIDSIPTPMVYCDGERRYRYVNDAFLQYVGMPAERVVGRTVREIFGEERWGSLEATLERVEAGESISTERLIRWADGHERWMLVRVTPRMDEHGRYAGFYSTTSDIHDQKMVEHELRRTNSTLSAHFDNTPLAVIEWDMDLRIARWSGQSEAIFGWSAAETLGRKLEGWRHVYEEDEAAAAGIIHGLVRGSHRHATSLHRNYRKDGTVIWVEWHHSALRDDAGRVISILSLAQDVSSRIQAEERLQYMATHDGLTALPNTVLLNDRLEAALARAHRARGRVGVMFLDLDHFKDVNDTLGHRVGDLLLKDVSRRIRATLRQSDVLARISGDEFVVVLEDLPDEGAPEHVAHKILDEIRRPFQVEGHEIHVSGSLGLALYPEDGGDAETLLKNADSAMYHAKELGRNGFRMFSRELAQRREHRMRVEKALRRALRADELQLHYQPIMDVATGKVTRAEALLRWNDPERGLVMPAGFIPLAEESGLGHAVGQWVLEAACRQARAWRDGAVGDITICVNLSASQLRDAGLVTDLKKTLARTGCEPRWLEFEITETSMVRDVEGASLVLAKLRALGVRIAIDDFGTGFSSLSHLRHLPVDILKVDRAFVADIEPAPIRTPPPGSRRRSDRAGGAAIVSAVIGLARGLGLDVVAEGVETKAQLSFLEREGCGACQGYLICTPLPAAGFETWLLNRRKGGARKKPVAPRRPVARKPAAKARKKAKTKA